MEASFFLAKFLGLVFVDILFYPEFQSGEDQTDL
jgi:hypothetical protein